MQSGYNKIQDLNNEILDQHLMSNNEMEKSNLMNVYHRGNNLSYLSACGFFEISKSNLAYSIQNLLHMNVLKGTNCLFFKLHIF